MLIWAQPLFLWDFSSAPCTVDVSGDGAGGTCRFVRGVADSASLAELGLNAIRLVPADAWDILGRWVFWWNIEAKIPEDGETGGT